MVEHPNIVGGLIGGLLIGFASLLLLVTTGRIAGISGIVGGAVRGPDRGWRVNFVAGLLLAGGIGFQLLQGVELRMQASGAWLVAAGLLVGLGTRIGSGCTSGHGVCGLGRRSPRSLVATGVFMGVGVLTVLVTRLFGAGLLISEMVDPARVLGFLDVAGEWDPTLMFVMGGALAVTVPSFTGPGLRILIVDSFWGRCCSAWDGAWPACAPGRPW